MIDSFPPGMIMVIGALLIPFLPHIVRQIFMMLLVLLSAYPLTLGIGVHTTINFFDLEFILFQSDALTIPFAIIFHIAAVLNIIYGAHVKHWKQHVAIMSYSGAAIAAVHAGDLLTLFVWWEATAFTSVFLILASNTRRSYKSAFRYIVIQVTSGMFLLAGALILLNNEGNALLTKFDINTLYGQLIFIAFGIKAAFPLLNGWLQDSYPEASEIGTVALSTFTTKLAIYCFAKCFAGTEILIAIGAIMTFYPIFFAVIENDLRRVLTYSLNNQLGFMIVAIGIGTELAINGAVAHAFAHILYKGLLFMGMGAVLYRVGTCKASELGGLFKYMPITAVCTIIGAISISAFPLFSGFVAKSLIMSALGKEGLVLVYFMLLFASAGVLHHSGIKIPFFAFFAHDSGIKTKEAPINMIAAMVIASLLCILIGVFPSLFYSILPYQIAYEPYDFSHVVGQLQLLTFAAFAFICLWHFKIYPPELNSTVLNSDWIYRKMIPGVLIPFLSMMSNLNIKMSNYIIDTSLKTKTYLANIMTRDRVFDREVGKDGLIILQVFTVFLVFVLVSQFF
ncbi:MAG: Na(+)/H(+) antiporter subunit D [Alphaproteobacteria bacterium]|jgi:multicomponent Na+:H+ antiporter subunit D|nr:Na(+)/H(+) antiporter subunit D [Alphaproteobacteria bacterium]